MTIAQSFDTKDWKPENAEANMTEAIEKIGKNNIAGVYSANDGMAGGVIKALEDAGVTDLPPITGQDAELSAVQRIVTGEQYMSVYKSYPQEAESAAEMAVARASRAGTSSSTPSPATRSTAPPTRAFPRSSSPLSP